MNEHIVKLENEIQTLTDSIDSIATQIIPMMSRIAEEKNLETQDDIADEKFTITITAKGFWAISEACGSYKYSILEYLKKQKQNEEYELQRQAENAEYEKKKAEREVRLKQFRESLSVGQRIQVGEISKYGKDQWMSGYCGEILKLNKTSATVKLDGYPDEKHYVKYALIEPLED